MVKTDIYPITDSGTRNGNVIGFICAKCLASATRMRLHVKAMLSQVMVAHKALMSFLARQASAMIDRVISYASPNAIYGETRRSDGPDVDRT